MIANAKKQAEIIKGEGDAKVIAIFAKSYGMDKEFFNFYRTMQSHQDYTKEKKIIMNFDNDYFKYITRQDARR
jgi:membrane protease subunit HflC